MLAQVAQTYSTPARQDSQQAAAQAAERSFPDMSDQLQVGSRQTPCRNQAKLADKSAYSPLQQ